MNVPSIESLQAQLAQIQALRDNVTTKIAPAATQSVVKPQIQANWPQVTAPTSVEELKKLVNELIDSKLNSKSAEQSNLAKLSQIVESHLEEKEKNWLTIPAVGSMLPEFLSSSNGHELIRLFIADFQEFYESKTRN